MVVSPRMPLFTRVKIHLDEPLWPHASGDPTSATIMNAAVHHHHLAEPSEDAVSSKSSTQSSPVLVGRSCSEPFVHVPQPEAGQQRVLVTVGKHALEVVIHDSIQTVDQLRNLLVAKASEHLGIDKQQGYRLTVIDADGVPIRVASVDDVRHWRRVDLAPSTFCPREKGVGLVRGRRSPCPSLGRRGRHAVRGLRQ